MQLSIFAPGVVPEYQATHRRPPRVMAILGTPVQVRIARLYASVAGGLAGYGIGVFGWETVGQWIVQHIAHMQLTEVNGRLDIALPAYLVSGMGASLGGEYLFQVYDHWNAWIVFIFGLTPLPYKLVTITAGVARVDLPVFLLASVLSRALRFFVVAWILSKWGDTARRFIDRYFNLLTIVFIVLLVGGFLVLKLIM